MASNATSILSRQMVNVILDSLIILCASITIVVSLTIIFVMTLFKSKRQTDRPAHLLSINMYISLFIGCTIMLNIYCYTIYGHLNPQISFDGHWCQIKAYLFYVSGCAFFYSYLLQAVYRLCRIVYYHKAFLQSSPLYIYGMIFQWMISFVQVLPVLSLGTFEYLPNDYHCQIALNNISGLIIGLALVHLIPITLTTICYLYTMIYIRRRSASIRNIRQQVRERRDAMILTRIFILLGLLIVSGLPTLGISVFSQLHGYLPFWSTQFQWLTANFCLTCVSIILFFVSPDLKKAREGSRRQQSVRFSSKTTDFIYPLL